MIAHGEIADAELRRDLFIGLAAGEQIQNFLFPVAEVHVSLLLPPSGDMHYRLAAPLPIFPVIE